MELKSKLRHLRVVSQTPAVMASISVFSPGVDSASLSLCSDDLRVRGLAINWCVLARELPVTPLTPEAGAGAGRRGINRRLEQPSLNTIMNIMHTCIMVSLYMWSQQKGFIYAIVASNKFYFRRRQIKSNECIRKYLPGCVYPSCMLNQ